MWIGIDAIKTSDIGVAIYEFFCCVDLIFITLKLGYRWDMMVAPLHIKDSVVFVMIAFWLPLDLPYSINCQKCFHPLWCLNHTQWSLLWTQGSVYVCWISDKNSQDCAVRLLAPSVLASSPGHSHPAFSIAHVWSLAQCTQTHEPEVWPFAYTWRGGPCVSPDIQNSIINFKIPRIKKKKNTWVYSIYIYIASIWCHIADILLNYILTDLGSN